MQLITANRITSLDSVNTKEFPLNHLSCCREQRILWRFNTRARLFYASKRPSGVIVKAYIRHLRVTMKRVKYWGIAHDSSATYARILLPSLNVLTKSNRQQTHGKIVHIFRVVFQELPLGSSPSPGPAASPFFRIERLQQEPVCTSPPAAAYFFFPSWLFFIEGLVSYPIPQKISQQTSSEEGEKKPMRAWWTVRLGGCAQWIWLNLPLRLFIQARGSQWELTHSTGCCCYTQRPPQPHWFVPRRKAE